MNKKVRMTKTLTKLLEMYSDVCNRAFNSVKGVPGGRLFLQGEIEALRQVFKEVYGVLPMCHTNEDGTVGYHLIYAH